MVEDVFNATILCNNCNSKTSKGFISKNGFRIRILKCDNCNKIYYHPGDVKDYERFKDLKQRDFSVKLRLVGNSYCVSIPREIVSFADLEKYIMMRISLESPNKLSMFFGDENARD